MLRFISIVLVVCFAFPAQAAIKWVDGNPIFYTPKPIKKKVVRKKRKTTKKVYRKKVKVARKKVKVAVPKQTRKSRVKYTKLTNGIQHGKASYYWRPQPIACSRKRRYNPNLLVAAHKTLPCGTIVRVTNKLNGRSVVVIIDDRGPYIKGRIVDMSLASAKILSMRRAGVVPVKLEVIREK